VWLFLAPIDGNKMIVTDYRVHREMATLMMHPPVAVSMAPKSPAAIMFDNIKKLPRYTNQSSPAVRVFKDLDITQRLEEFSFAGMGNFPKQIEAIELMNAAAVEIRKLRNGHQT
jgi:hypothetical protein